MSMLTDAETTSPLFPIREADGPVDSPGDRQLRALDMKLQGPPHHTLIPSASRDSFFSRKLTGYLAMGVGALGIIGFLLILGGHRLPVVSVVEVSSRATASGIVAEGAIVPSAVAYVTPVLTMRDPIAHVYVEAGSHVTKGQILADIDPVTQQAALAQAQTNLTSQQIKLKSIASPYRIEQLRQAEFDLQSSHQQVVAAQAALDLLRNGSTPQEIATAVAAVDTATAQLKQAEQQNGAYKTLYTKGSPEVAAANADVANDQTRMEMADKRYTSYKRLFANGIVSRLQFEQADTDQAVARTTLAQAKERLSLVQRDTFVQYNQSGTNLSVAQAALTQAKERLNLLRQGSRVELVQGAEARLNQARATEQAQAQNYAMLKAGVSPDPIYKVHLADALANAQQAEAEVSYRKELIRNRYLRSPITGVVVARNINPGEIAMGNAARSTSSNPLSNNTQSLFVIAADTSHEFLANVDQRFLGSVSVGQQATVQVESLPDIKFTGKVTRLNPVISLPGAANGNNNAMTPMTFPVWIRVDDPNGRLAFGQNGFVSLGGKQSGITVPQAAVVPMTVGQGIVYTEKNGTVFAHPVHFTKGTDGYLRVTSGLVNGDHVVVSDSTRLADGVKVQPILTQPDTIGMAPLR